MRSAAHLSFRLRDERGQALVLAIAIVVVGLLLGLGALAYAFNADHSSVHDERGRSAQQAADAGVQKQLYVNSDSASVGYNNDASLLGITDLLDCAVPEILGGTGVNADVTIGTIQVAASAYNGACPTSCTSKTSCTTTGDGSAPWEPLDDEDYYQSEFFPNAQEAGSSTYTGDAIEYPDIVSIGCHTTVASSRISSCSGGSSGNDYSRQLDLLAPTGPLQAVEAANDLTINSSTSALTNFISGIANQVNCSVTLNLVVAEVLTCSLPSSLSSLLSLPGISSLLGSVQVSLLGFNLSQFVSSLVGNLTSTLTSDLSTAGLTGLAIVDGNLSAGHNLSLPATTVDLNTSTSSEDGGSGTLVGVLGAVGGVVSNLDNLFSTFEYGSKVCPAGGSTSSCTASPSSGLDLLGVGGGKPVTAIAPHYVQSTGVCAAGDPSGAETSTGGSCTIQRPSFNVNTPVTTQATSGASTIPRGASLSGGSATYVDGDLTLTSGATLTLPAGTYVFCSVDAEAGSELGNSGAVQIYVLPPTSSSCTATKSTAGYVQPGDFVACSGVDNTLNTLGGGALGTLTLGSVTSAVNPSALQIYVAGSDDYANGTTLPSGGNDTDGGVNEACPTISEPFGSGTGDYEPPNPTSNLATQVYIGNSSGLNLTEGLVVYAPDSEVTVSTTAAIEGSVIGWNVNLTAAAVLQDLDLGNYPLSPLINAYQVAETVQCDNSVENLTGLETGGAGGAGDLNGCKG